MLLLLLLGKNIHPLWLWMGTGSPQREYWRWTHTFRGLQGPKPSRVLHYVWWLAYVFSSLTGGGQPLPAAGCV